jgi:hypothetical protein
MMQPASRTDAGSSAIRDQKDAAMTISKNIIFAVALSAISFAGNAGASLAGEAAKTQTIKPLQGLSFEAGQKRGIGYFTSDASTCKLVLTLADTPNQDEPQGFTVSRYEAAVPAGKNTRYSSEEGRTFEFGCNAHAEAMTFKPLRSIASAQGEETR